MFTYFNRLKNKKGFTLVEMIVVVAIIGIMTSVAVPNIIGSNRRAENQRHNAQARSFYLAVHQVLTNAMQDDNTEIEFRLQLESGVTTRRISGVNPIVTRPADNFFFFYAVINDSGVITHADLAFAPAEGTGGYTTWDDTAARSNAIALFPPADPDAQTVNERTFRRFVEEVGGYTDLSSQPGFYYAMFDTQFRVIVAYYSFFADRADGVGIGTARYVFNDDNRIGARNAAFGSFPREYGFVGIIGGRAGVPERNRTANPRWFTDIIPVL
jgi:prepilin-type N-terminal cleavage/methylation domain-containing protein